MNLNIFLVSLSLILRITYSKDELKAFTASESCRINYSLCSTEELEYIAISNLHDQIDDDKNGGIDIAESKDFVKESLSNGHGTERAKQFHYSDAHIDKQDLWHIWKSSEVYNWTTSDLINWLTVEVELPQYGTVFTTRKLNGSTLPRFTDDDFLAKVLKIDNSIHRKKIMIKAVDVILFGSLKRYRLSTESVLAIVIFFISIITYLVIQNQYSKRFVQTMKIKLNDLSETERNLSELRNKLKIVEDVQNQKDSEIQRMKEQHKYEITQAVNSSRESLVDDQGRSNSQQEINKLRSALQEAQTQINHLTKKSASLPLNSELYRDNHQLQMLLQLTHSIESQYLADKIAQIDHQSVEFMELNEKVKKRKSAFLGPFRIIHSSDMENIEKGFANTKRAYEKIIHEKRDKDHRWSQIESITGLNLTKTNDVNNLRQIIKLDFEDVHKKDHKNVSVMSTNGVLDSTISETKTEKTCLSPELSIYSSFDNTDPNADELIRTKSASAQVKDGPIFIKSNRKDTLEKKRNLYKSGKI